MQMEISRRPTSAKLVWFSVAVSLTALSVAQENGTRLELKLGFMGMGYMRYGPPFKIPNIGSALPIALADVEKDPDILPNHTFSFVIKDSMCDPRLSVGHLVTLVLEDHVDAIIGPACAEACESLGYLASNWNIPVISYSCWSEELSNKRIFDTFLRTSAVFSDLAKVFEVVLANYNWRRIGLIHDTDAGYNIIAADATADYLQTRNVTVAAVEKYSFEHIKENVSPSHFLGPLKKLAAVSRVIIIVGTRPELRAILEAAAQLGYPQTGEYVFISLDTHLTEKATRFQEWMFTGDETRDAALTSAYEYLIHVAKIPYFLNEEYTTFLEAVYEQLAERPFSSRLDSVAQVSEYAGFLYDAGMLYARTADKMLRDGQDPRNGKLFLQYATTVVFPGKTGSVSVNEHGDRNEDHAIYDFQNNTMKMVAYYDGFLNKYIPQREVIWPGGSTPKDTPPCGFEGELCIKEPAEDMTTTIVAAVMGGALIFIVVGGYLGYRKRQFEMELVATNWKINFTDLLFTMKEGLKSSIFSMGNSVGGSERGGAAREDIATYMSNQVFVKKVHGGPIDWKKRSILLELKQMKDTRNDNLNPFIGACVEPQHLCLVTAHCPRGSLEDVLANDNIQLDFVFKMSFSMDMVNGVNYLHKSAFKYHGALKSSNCLIDSRWNIKLSDYGLCEFLKGQNTDRFEGEYARYKHLLWTAPEHLRGAEPGVTGSAKGDIYSVGVVLQEIILRSAPYCSSDLAPKDIIEKVKAGGPKKFRPDFPKDGSPAILRELIASCWEENPSERPDIAHVIKQLRKANGGKKINIMDQMVSLLEKYASNLEDIVQERTKQLNEEKQRTDMLLYQMLPRSVADQLKSGKSVAAETFNSVTIFFSDIVGFTSLSSASTPMQVVDLLNDLYTMFDDIIDTLDVYKVETIGDAYMVASGLPNRNGDRHAGEIATMCLELLSATRTFRVRHIPDRKLLLRVGIHTGPCVAGVVGLKMPRYCLFGDTVNTASRMESNGKALRCHVSSSTRDLLEILGGYQIVERGQVEMKGKGIQMTYWLVGKNGFTKNVPTLAETEGLTS